MQSSIVSETIANNHRPIWLVTIRETKLVNLVSGIKEI